MGQARGRSRHDESLCGGLFKYVDELRRENKEKEKERCEMMNNQNCITLSNYVTVNDIKCHEQKIRN